MNYKPHIYIYSQKIEAIFAKKTLLLFFLFLMQLLVQVPDNIQPSLFNLISIAYIPPIILLINMISQLFESKSHLCLIEYNLNYC